VAELARRALRRLLGLPQFAFKEDSIKFSNSDLFSHYDIPTFSRM